MKWSKGNQSLKEGGKEVKPRLEWIEYIEKLATRIRKTLLEVKRLARDRRRAEGL